MPAAVLCWATTLKNPSARYLAYGGTAIVVLLAGLSETEPTEQAGIAVPTSSFSDAQVSVPDESGGSDTTPETTVAPAPPSQSAADPKTDEPGDESPPEEVVQAAVEWSCSDPDNDLEVEWVGDGSQRAPRVGDWIEVDDLTVSREASEILIDWSLSAPIPRDVGSDAIWGDWIASWTVVLRGDAYDYSVNIAVDKEGSQEPRLAAELYDVEANWIYSLEENGPHRLEVENQSIRISVPAEDLAFVGPNPIVLAAAEFSTTTIGGATDGTWYYTDNVCSTNSPDEDGAWDVETQTMPVSALPAPPIATAPTPSPDLANRDMCRPDDSASMWIDRTCLEEWPFGTIAGGLLECRGFDILFLADSEVYSLNGNARKKDEYTDVFTIFRAGDGSRPGAVQDLIDLALDLVGCDIRG